MASVAGRKKSVVSSTGLHIDTPVARNTFLNKSAASSTSLYQQCSQLRSRLLRVHDFQPFFAIAASGESRTSMDPVSQLWDCFALGVPLVFLHNLLPSVAPITSVDLNPSSIDVCDSKAIKKAIVHFAMAIGNTDLYDQTDQFTATQLLDRDSTEGFVKVVNCVTRLVDRLPNKCFQEAPPMSPSSALPAHESTDSLLNPDSLSQGPPATAQETARNNVIKEMVETERKYVQDLEHMQKYAVALNASSAIDQDTIHLLFPGLNKLLDFQRRFLIKLEGVAELPWKDQRWGLHFIENEEEFAVYEPYCANYSHAMDLLLTVESNLMAVTLINAKSELPAFLIKPIQRICKYPLLLDSLVKAASKSDYAYYDELQQGFEAAKRIADRINEAQRRSENLQTVATLEARVEDWKGHHLSNFGDLILEDVFMVMKMDIDREYHVFLFEKIILCCKEVIPVQNGVAPRKGSKSNSILKKQQASVSTASNGPPKKKTTPLLLKGRIFLNNVTHTHHSIVPGPTTPQYMLQVWWRGDDENEYFTLRCRSEEQLNKWESEINRLIERAQARRGSEAAKSHQLMQANNANSLQTRQVNDASRKLSTASTQNYFSIASPITSSAARQAVVGYDLDDCRAVESNISATGFYMGNNDSGPSGYPRDVDNDIEEDYEEYPPASHYASSSGRGTPISTRRGNISQSMVQERDFVNYDRPRARTEDQNGSVMRQWRNNNNSRLPPPLPPPAGGLPNPYMNASRPPMSSRIASDASEASFGPAVNIRTEPALRSQFSSARLDLTYDNDGERSRAGSPSTRAPPRPSRSRSASQPSAHHVAMIAQPPPVPKPHWAEGSKISMSGSVNNKRGSGSSESMGDSSEYSPHSMSPVTPFGSSDSSIAAPPLRPSRSAQMLVKSTPASVVTPRLNISPLVKVKVHFLEDIFIIQVPRMIEYEELVEKVGKKIRLCGSLREDGPLKVKYIDEDGDMVSLGSTEDVQMAFETMTANNQVTLYVS